MTTTTPTVGTRIRVADHVLGYAGLIGTITDITAPNQQSSIIAVTIGDEYRLLDLNRNEFEVI